MLKIANYIITLILGLLIGLTLPDLFSLKEKKKENKILYWVAPMDANYKRDKPGKSPMGMALVPVYQNNNNPTEKGLRINAAIQNNISIKLSPVERKTLFNKIETVGYVSQDKNNIVKVNSYVEGWIQNLKVNSNGVRVKKGDLLFNLYSPKLTSAQQEYLLALKTNNSLVTASMKKLLTLGLNQKQINEIKKTRTVKETLQIYAKSSGFISNLMIRDGMYIKKELTLMSIIDLSKIWIEAEVYASDVSYIKLGQKALAIFNVYPNKQWQGELTFIASKLSQVTRTLKVRFEFPNPDLLLKPNMFSEITIHTSPVREAISIPKNALIQNNNMNYVIKSLKNNAFYAQEVKVGLSMDNNIQIIEGLKEGEQVVSSGHFLIDSESNIQESIRRLIPNSPIKKVGKVIYAFGKILSIDYQKRKVMLDHQSIEALNMPSMIMDFSLDKTVDITRLKVNDTINFALVKNTNGDYSIKCLAEAK